ncbi:MAG: hypothetical protein IPP62_08320 [bacterium]|nr:hypothetical protein [bacterium]
MRLWRFLLLTLLILATLPGVVAAGLDPRTDSIGIYFDTGGNTNCAPVGMFVPTNIYLLLSNPAGPTNGFECTLTPVGVPYFILSTNLGPNTLDVDGSANGFAVGAASNYPVVGGQIVLATLSVMLQGAGELAFYITDATAPSLAGELPVVTGDGVLRRCSVASGSVTIPVGGMNMSVCPPIPGDPTLPQDYSIDITASTATMQDTAIHAASALNATDGYDGGLDVPKPTPPPAGYVQASFRQPGWPLGPRFAADVRSRFDPLLEYKIWNFMVETDRSGSVTLSFAPDFSAGEVAHFYLRDVATGLYHNLFPSLTHVFTNDGLPNTYHFELIVGAAPIPPALDPTSRSLPVGWSLVGLPLTPNAGATVSGLLTDPSPGNAYAYDYPGGAYRLLDGSTPVAQGSGYWLATDAAFDWSMTGLRNLDGVTVPLRAGWNLVGNAIWFTGPREGLRVIYGGNTYEWLAAVQAGLVSASVQGYDSASGTYLDAADLRPWHGYWINALQTGVSLRFYWGHFLELNAGADTKVRLDPDDDSWQSDLVLVDAAGQRRALTIGMGTEATAGFDAMHDRSLPPQSPAGGPQLFLHRPEWELAAGSAISRDIVNLSDEVTSWRVVATSPNPGRAFLTWDPADWPAGVDFQLYVPTENRVAVMSMRRTTSYPLVLGSKAIEVVVRTPDLTSGTDVPGVQDYGLTVSPNPFNPQTTVAFDLPAAGRAEIRIYSVRGELVAVLGGRHYEAGHHREIWAGRDRQGRDVPSGTYFARLYSDNEARGPVSRMSLVR